MKWRLKTDIRFFPFVKSIKRYKSSYVKDDLLAAFSVALLAIPQAIAYSLLAGLPSSAGLFSAIFGSIFTASFCSSSYLVVGPSTGVSILIQTAIFDALHMYYPEAVGMEKEMLSLQILAHIVLIIGLVQVIAAFLNLKKILQFVSRSVILGYFSGIMIAIIINQLFYFLGIDPAKGVSPVIIKATYLFTHLQLINLSSLFIGGVSLILLIGFHYKIKKIPGSFLVLIIMTAFAYLIYRYDLFFHQSLKIPKISDLGFVSTKHIQFSWLLLNFTMIHQIFISALAIALLAILEVFSVSRGLSIKTGENVKSNQETFAIGVSNTVLSMIFGAMPASGSMSRTLLNWRNHAKSRFSALFSGIFLAFLVFLGWPFIQHIPLACLAAILIALVPTLFDLKNIKVCFRATKGDAIVFLLTMFSCFFFTLDMAFYIGIIISLVFFLKKAAIPRIVEYAFDEAGRLQMIAPTKPLHRKIRIIGIGGELFFAAADFLQDFVVNVAKDPYMQVVILKFNAVYHIDASMCFALLHLHDHLKEKNKHLIISGVTESVWQVLNRSGVVKILGPDNIFFTDETRPQLSTWRACQRAEDIIG